MAAFSLDLNTNTAMDSPRGDVLREPFPLDKSLCRGISVSLASISRDVLALLSKLHGS